jgi:hypothetical protein
MMKILSAIGATALTVGGAGYSYVTKVEAEITQLHLDLDAKSAKIAGYDQAIDEAIRALQMVQAKEGRAK